jgi:hypothetical protein
LGPAVPICREFEIRNSRKSGDLDQEVNMRYVKYLALLTVLMVPLAYSQAQVRVGVGIGFGGVGVAVGPAYAAGPPVCAYGYYPYYPYACAPYGYYAPSYFVDGVFIGAGPWYHWGHPAYFWNRGYYGRAYVGRDWDHDRWAGRGWDHDRGVHRGWGEAHGGNVHNYAGNGFRGGESFHGGGEVRGAGGFHARGGFHGGPRR